ncbi:MAG: hypothetical protein EA412_10345, partial [Chitinophagaceae bacterium]
NKTNHGGKKQQRESHCRDAMHCVSTQSHAFPASSNPAKNQFGPQSKNLASIVRGFKSAVAIQARIIEPDFAWQSRFHDHIIRDKTSYYRIAQYIKNNPANWAEDRFNPSNQNSK